MGKAAKDPQEAAELVNSRVLKLVCTPSPSLWLGAADLALGQPVELGSQGVA